MRNTYARWWGLLAGIIAAGLLSRVVHTGFVFWDKYLGDALYAAMVYALLRLSGRVRWVALWAVVVMVGIEVFQLTGLPACWLRSEYAAVRVCARLMGTQFSVWDLAAYGAGIALIAFADRGYLPTTQR